MAGGLRPVEQLLQPGDKIDDLLLRTHARILEMQTTAQLTLRKSRPYVIVGCFAVGMVLTPPDVFSQSLLAVPMAAVRSRRDLRQHDPKARGTFPAASAPCRRQSSRRSHRGGSCAG
ncbi:MAG: twin-arginine translocase subunit TatC, partial [Rhizobium sp.]|nr:twin-arginine translocase subunit TatC [Rhizobium sp.]